MLLALEDFARSESRSRQSWTTCYLDGIDPDEPMATVKKQFDLLNLH